MEIVAKCACPDLASCLRLRQHGATMTCLAAVLGWWLSTQPVIIAAV
jgi:hypothetical protein